MGKLQQWMILAGRLLLGLAFMGSGLIKMASWDAMLKWLATTSVNQYVSAELMPTVLVAQILIEVIGGFFLCLGFRTRVAASLLALLMAWALFFLHDMATKQTFAREYTAFLNDTKVLGGLLFVAVFGAGKYSIDKH